MINKLWIAGGVLVLLALVTGIVSPASKIGSAAIAFGVLGALGALKSIFAEWRRWLKASPEDKAAAIEREKALAVENIQEDALQKSKVNSIEIIAFRFMLMVWCVGLISLAFSGAANYIQNLKQQEVDSLANSTITPCTNEVFKTISDCNRPMSESDGTCSSAVNRCYGFEFDQLIRERDDWSERAEIFLNAALWILILPTLLFYAIRWGLTGQLKPFWILKR